MEEESLTEEQIQDINDVFDVIDENKSNSIDVKELARGLRGLGLNPTNAEIQKLMDKYDNDGTETLDRDEFTKLFTDCLHTLTTTDELLREQFAKLDANGNGYIEAEELRKVLLYGDEKLTEDEVENIISEFDKSGDGQISLAEFLEGILGKA
ncbi:hypothetical protein SteCoe_13599 [Stentor coeruleus]|uniref:EF-hand domain-containing protein n=1 Tax=Stentor coeruleus TaxID=5963 RepID=A0A1R2C7Z8_9CILI|nr:hypothetical protein SteCoe_13599 [Stentor coeruleus]